MTVSRSPGYRVRRVGTLAESAGPAGRAQPAEQVQAAKPADSAKPAGQAKPIGVMGEGELAQPPERLRGRRWASRRKMPGLAALAALGLAGTVGFGVAWALKGDGPPTTAVATSARNLVLALTNFDPGTISADFAQIQRDSTGAFAGQARRFFGTSIQQELTSADAASRGTLEDLYVQSVDGDHASVFAVVSQRYLNKNAGQPVSDTLRLALGMTDIGGTWKTSSVQVLQQPVSSPTAGSTAPSSGGSKKSSGKS
jgi:hypothetical protein